MKMEEIRQLSLDELRKRLVDEEENLANLRFQLATRQLDSPIRVRTVRRDIARIQTLIKEREMAAPLASGLAAAASAAKAPTAAPLAAPPAPPQTSETKAS